MLIMVTFEYIKSKASKSIPHGKERESIILYLTEKSNIAKALRSLLEIFGSDDDSQHIICLVRQGQEVGYIQEEDLYDLVETRVKVGIDDAAGNVLPGQLYFVGKYKCPYAYAQCNQYYWITGDIDIESSSYIPKCKVHDNIDMIKEI